MYAKFQGQKIQQKKDILILPTCVVVRITFYICVKIYPKNDTIPRGEKIVVTTTNFGRTSITFWYKYFELGILRHMLLT